MHLAHTGASRGVLTPPFAQIAPVLLQMTPPHLPASKEPTMYRVNTKPTTPVNGWHWRGLVSEEDGAPVLERADPTPRTPSEDVSHDPAKKITR